MPILNELKWTARENEHRVRRGVVYKMSDKLQLYIIWHTTKEEDKTNTSESLLSVNEFKMPTDKRLHIVYTIVFCCLDVAEWEEPHGGMFLWFKLKGFKDSRILIGEKGLKHGVGLNYYYYKYIA